jgi:hypothetical protein
MIFFSFLATLGSVFLGTQLFDIKPHATMISLMGTARVCIILLFSKLYHFIKAKTVHKNNLSWLKCFQEETVFLQLMYVQQKNLTIDIISLEKCSFFPTRLLTIQ